MESQNKTRHKPDPIYLGLLIRDTRKRAKLSQEQLAAIIGISARHVSSIESGAKLPSLELLFRLVTTLGISGDDVFYHAWHPEMPLQSKREMLGHLALRSTEAELDIAITVLMAVLEHVVPDDLTGIPAEAVLN